MYDSGGLSMGAHLGEPFLHASGVHARLGDPSMFPLPEPQGDEAAPVVPHDAQLAAHTLAVLDLTEAVRELTAILARPPWYTRAWRWLRNLLPDVGEG